MKRALSELVVGAVAGRSVLLVSVGGILLLGGPSSTARAPRASHTSHTSHPFTAMEHAEYDVKYGPIHAGNGTLSVLGIDTVRGRDAYHFRQTIGGGVNLLLYKYSMRDTMES